jgi:hypothetical protein
VAEQPLIQPAISRLGSYLRLFGADLGLEGLVYLVSEFCMSASRASGRAGGVDLVGSSQGGRFGCLLDGGLLPALPHTSHTVGAEDTEIRDFPSEQRVLECEYFRPLC